MVAATPELAGILTDLFVLLLAAKVGDEIFKRIRQPAIVGEILAGVLVGPAVFGLVEPGEVVEVFAELGVVFLLFWVGLETKIGELRDVGRVAVGVGLLGVALPFAGGFGIGLAITDSTAAAIFVGAALVATSVGITSAVLLEIGLLGGRAGRTILGAAVIDDILAMIVLAVAVGISAEGGVDVLQLGAVIALALGFVAFFALGGTAFVRRRPALLHAPRFSESPLLPAVILCLGLAAFSANIGLAAIIGAFLAGLIVAETKEQHPIEEEVAPLYAFFPPFFFAFIGLQIDLGAFADGRTLAILLLVTAIAVVTKFVGAWIPARGLGPRDAVFVGLGMVPRGEVGIIIAGIGATAAVIDAEVFAIVVGMSLLTTLMVPPLLRLAAPRDEGGRGGETGSLPAPPPPGPTPP